MRSPKVRYQWNETLKTHAFPEVILSKSENVAGPEGIRNVLPRDTDLARHFLPETAQSHQAAKCLILAKASFLEE